MPYPPPPFEWVDGDPIWAKRFTLIELASITCGALIPIIALLGSFGVLQGLPGYLVALASLAGSGGILGAAIPGWWLPRRRPVVRRLGISPVELRLEYSFRKMETPWNRVRWWDPFRIEVLQWAGSSRFLLTDSQAIRIRHFFEHDHPLPSSIPGGRRLPLQQVSGRWSAIRR
jgi:hypothetical protein